MADIPNVGQPVKREIVQATHPDYQDAHNLARLYRETVDGTGGYAPFTNDVRVRDQWPTDENHGSIAFNTNERTYLYRHPREQMKFFRRRFMAYHVGVVRKALRMVVGFLTKKDANYSEYPSQLTSWMESVNQRSATWRLLKNTDLVPQTLYYGRVPVLLHYPPHEAQTRAQQLDLGADLVCQPICPESIMDWRENDRGGYEWLKYVEDRDLTESPLSDGHLRLKRYHYLTQEGWWIIDELPDTQAREWPVVAAGAWDTGRMPLVMWKINQSGSSLVHHAAQLERELYNVTSLLQEIEREITFPQLVLPDPGENERVNVRAVDAILWAEPDSDWQPYILPPDVKALEHLRQREEDLKARILEEFGLEFSEGATTGVAQSFKMSKIVRLLVDIAGDLEESEFMTHSLAAEMLGTELPLTARAQWPAEFDARDVEKEVNALLAVLAEGPALGNTALTRLRTRLVTTVDPNTDENTKQTIEGEIRTEVEAESNEDMRTLPEPTGEPPNPEQYGAR
jgi:hypothetical protein